METVKNELVVSKLTVKETNALQVLDGSLVDAFKAMASKTVNWEATKSDSLEEHKDYNGAMKTRRTGTIVFEDGSQVFVILRD